MTVTGIDYDEATSVLEAAGGHVKTALVMHLAGVSSEEAMRRLNVAAGFVRPAIEDRAYMPD